MVFNLQGKLLALLFGVCLVALSSAFVLRELLVKDFKALNTVKDQQHIFQVLTSLEGHFEQQGGLRRATLVDELARALQGGIEARLYDPEGNLLIDTEQAMDELPLLTRKRIMLATGYDRNAPGRDSFITYSFSLTNQELGWLEARQLRPLNEQQFLQAANRFLLGSVLALGVLSLGLGAFFARLLSRPLANLTIVAESIATGDLSQRVQVGSADEIGRLAIAFNRMADALEVHERLRRQLVSNAAHELRTPLMIIRGELEGMLDNVLPISNEALQSLHQETARLTAILDGVDELTRAEASVLNLRPELVQLKPLFAGLVTRFGRMAEEKQVRLMVICADEQTAWADPDRLSQVLINLLSNALRAVPPHGLVELRGATASDGSTVIEVFDTGSGIADELLPHIFARFYKGKDGGLGLGLSISKELVAAHQGSLAVASKPGKGTIFTVTLPAR